MTTIKILQKQMAEAMAIEAWDISRRNEYVVDIAIETDIYCSGIIKAYAAMIQIATGNNHRNCIEAGNSIADLMKYKDNLLIECVMATRETKEEFVARVIKYLGN